MLATCLGAGVFAPTPVALVDENGAEATSAAVPQLGRKTLTASYADATETTAYQWQFSNDGDTWIDIYGETAQTCSLSYAKVKNMLDADGEAQLRCVVTDGEDERISSAATVTVDYSAPASQPAVQAKSAPARAASYARSASTMNADATAPATYNVVIKYEFENGEVVAEPYTANLAAGSPFSATVTFPTVQGYLPYVGETQQNSIYLNYAAIDQNYTINVVYKPTNVDYTVIHYKQNLNDDKYTVAERETKKGLTGSTVPEVAKPDEGFYALLYEKPAIAADGSTVVEVYYDRYYYLMNFDLDGGYGVEPIYARFGAPISDVGTPTKAGYTFGGWSFNGSPVTKLPTTMPAENRTYKAVWKADDTAKVTIVFWGENADDEEYSYIRSMQVDATPGESYSYDGSQYIHNHTNSCYAGVGNTVNSRYYYTIGNEINGCIGVYGDDGLFGFYEKGKCIYINGTWYVYNGNLTEGSIAEVTCGKLNSDLWTFVKSDTVTVAADGSSVVNVYYDRTEKTLTFHYNYSYNMGYRSSDTVTAKWGADIGQKFLAINSKAKGNLWSRYENGNSPWTSYLQIMPKESRDYYCNNTSTTEQSAEYYTETLTPGQYELEYTVTAYYGESWLTISEEDFYPMDGFTYDHGTDGENNSMPKPGSYSYFSGAKFYYTRNSYTLTFNDGYNDVKKESVKYEAPLSTYSSYVPEVPSAYEPGSVTFGGWYLNPECTGAEYKLDTHKMPADNVLLYAKWVPVTHKVEFYMDKAALEAGTKLSTHPDITVPHGSKADPTPEAPENGSYNFVGWFYMDNGVEKAFDFANMPVNKDMQVYGKWSSNVLKPYFIYYKIQGTDTEIADPTTGSGLAGVTKTFEAKGGTDLYAGYQEGYFPVTKSHSLKLDINATEENNTNVYTFWYVQKEAVPYTVKYLNKETGEPVAPEKTVSDNRKAVVTETFVPVSGMMPDAYQKRLVVSAEEGAVNEIIFYYTEDTTHAYYKITHYTENLAKDSQGNPTWTEYASSQAVGNIGKTYNADPMTIPGFTYDSKVPGTVVDGELTANGLELKLYYTRNSYPYQVRYLEQGTGKQLADPKNSTGKYGQVIYESAIDIENYTAVAPTSQTLNIRIEESSTEAKLNIITFYYKEKEATINYVAVGPEGATDFGSVNPTSETVKVLSGKAQGSTATASSNTYRFVGWYSDAKCTNQLSTDAKYVPAKINNLNVSATYYAKFEYNLTDLKITKKATPYDANDMFIFTVKHGNEVVAKVALKAGESVTIKNLTVGETYTVTEDTSWSWRYKDVEAQEITLQPSNNEVTVTNTLDNNNWLGASSYAINRCVDSVVTRVVDAVKSILGN